MKNKKGFTIVELVIVIAVIGILAAVLIPTFSNVVEKAKISKRLQTARGALSELIVENDGTLENNSYIYVKDNASDNTFVAWYRYNDGKLVSLDQEPELDIDYAYPITNANAEIANTVLVLRPIVKNVVNKLNEILVEDSATTYLDIANAGKQITDLDMEIINYRGAEYKFGYSLSTNKVFIMNDEESSVIYSNTGLSSVPTDKKVLVGANIKTAQDLIDLTSATNLHDGANPTDANIYVSADNTKSPLVIANVNGNVDMSNTSEYVPMANWENIWNRKDWHQIHLLFNGNNKSINKMYNALVGILAPGSIIRDITISYDMGTQSAPFSAIAAPHNQSTENYHFGLLAREVVKSGTVQTYDNILIKNVKLTGTSYWKDISGNKDPHDSAIVIGGVMNGSTTNTTNKLITFDSLDLFTEDGDYCGFNDSTPEIFAILIGNPEKNQFEWTNIVYDGIDTASDRHSAFRNGPGGNHVMPYIGIIA